MKNGVVFLFLVTLAKRKAKIVKILLTFTWNKIIFNYEIFIGLYQHDHGPIQKT